MDAGIPGLSLGSVKQSSRRTHRKARTGCSICKKRKIKCDEQKPACGNCIKHSVECDFRSIQPTTDCQSPGGFSTKSNKSSSARRRVIEPAPSPNGNVSRDQIQQQSPSLNLLDLELLHNYSTSTFLTLHNDPNLRTIWRITVPQIGFNYDFVMHSVLAISALHLAHFVPRKREFYRSQALLHQQTGLRLATPMLLHVTDENSSALYLFTALTCVFAIASFPRPGQLVPVDDPWVADWLSLFRGTRSVIETSRVALRQGALGLMFKDGARRSQLREELRADPPEEEDHLTQLQMLINENAIDRESLPVYTTAINELRKSYFVIYKNGTQTLQSTDIFIWLFVITDEYMQLLKSETQESLAILAHFCVIPKRLEFNWWIEGWSIHLLSRIYALLDNEHRLWIRWPIEEIGWVPGEGV